MAFNITQFFPSLNHHLLLLILNKAGFNQKILTFFSNYLVNRKTKYLWNNFSSPLCNVNVGVGQESAFSLILSTLYLLPIFYIFKKCLKNLNIDTNLFCSYNIILSLLTRFRLVMEHSKTEIFHFSRSHGTFNPSPLDLISLNEPTLLSKLT